jgi:hypothetical protein
VHANSVDVLIGDGAGNFAAPVNYTTSIPNPVAAALIDTNGDTFVDVMVARGTPDIRGNSAVSTLLGNGAGGFAAASTSHYAGTMTYGVFALRRARQHAFSCAVRTIAPGLSAGAIDRTTPSHRDPGTRWSAAR